MRTLLLGNSDSWIKRLDCAQLIIIAVCLRVILASGYDAYVVLTGNDPLLPDSRFYSVNGQYVAATLNKYNIAIYGNYYFPGDSVGRAIFNDAVNMNKGGLPKHFNETTVFQYIVGVMYFIFGVHTILIRLLNIALSIACTWFVFDIIRKKVREDIAVVFLAVALFLPTQVCYSITLSKDFLRAFAVTFILWGIYGRSRT